MQITLHMMGQLMEVRPNEYKNKDGKIIEQTELTVLFSGLSEDGYKNISADKVLIEGQEEVDAFRLLIGKFVSIPYSFTVNDYGSKCTLDRNMPVLTFEKNPLDYSKYERKTSKA